MLLEICDVWLFQQIVARYLLKHVLMSKPFAIANAIVFGGNLMKSMVSKSMVAALIE